MSRDVPSVHTWREKVAALHEHQQAVAAAHAATAAHQLDQVGRPGDKRPATSQESGAGRDQ